MRSEVHERIRDTAQHIAKAARAECEVCIQRSCFQQVVPGVFFFLGVTPGEHEAETAEPNHSPRFRVDESSLPLGVRALAQLTCDYLEAPESARRLK